MSEQVPSEEPRACPFCGDDARHQQKFWPPVHFVECTGLECGAEGPPKESEELAVDAWNRRIA